MQICRFSFDKLLNFSCVLIIQPEVFKESIKFCCTLTFQIIFHFLPKWKYLRRCWTWSYLGCIALKCNVQLSSELIVNSSVWSRSAPPQTLTLRSNILSLATIVSRSGFCLFPFQPGSNPSPPPHMLSTCRLAKVEDISWGMGAHGGVPLLCPC